MSIRFKPFTAILALVVSVLLPLLALSQAASAATAYSKQWVPVNYSSAFEIQSTWRCVDSDTMHERHVIRNGGIARRFYTFDMAQRVGVEFSFREEGQEGTYPLDPYRHTVWLDQLVTLNDDGTLAAIPRGRVFEMERPAIEVWEVEQRRLTKELRADGSGYDVTYGAWQGPAGDFVRFNLQCHQQGLLDK